MDEVLLLFSGGRDSFLSACRLVENGYYVHLVTYDNGCMSNIKPVYNTKDRIINKYGISHITFDGIRNIAKQLYSLHQVFSSKTLTEWAEKYPDIRSAQVCCLNCHTCMVADAIVYAYKNNIQYIADGGRKSQGFIVELPEMVLKYKMLCKSLNLNLLLPVFNLEDDFERKLELADRGFVPKTFEPQCFAGSPLRQKLTEEEIKSLVDYYTDIIEPIVLNNIVTIVH